MRTQKIIKIGNSAGVILPIDFVRTNKLKLGDKIEMTLHKASKSILLTPAKFKSKVMKRYDFFNWLDEYTEKNKDLIRELAKY